MSGHTHMNSPGLTQNQGNILGDRPCVRQSRLYREGCGGNAMKELLGQDSLKWDTTQTQGVYRGGHVYDHNTEDCLAVAGSNSNSNNDPAQPGAHQQYRHQQQQQQQQQQRRPSNETGEGNMRVYTPKKVDQQQQQRGQAAQYQSYNDMDGNVQVVAMDVEDSPTSQQQQPVRGSTNSNSNFQTSNGAYGAAPQRNNNSNNESSQPQQDEGRSVTGRGFRPGCGQANRQTYNIFTGQ